MKKQLLHLRDEDLPLPTQLIEGAARGKDTQHDLGPVMAELVNVKEDLDGLRRVFRRIESLLAEELLYFPLNIPRCSNA